MGMLFQNLYSCLFRMIYLEMQSVTGQPDINLPKLEEIVERLQSPVTDVIEASLNEMDADNIEEYVLQHINPICKLFCATICHYYFNDECKDWLNLPAFKDEELACDCLLAPFTHLQLSSTESEKSPIISYILSIFKVVIESKSFICETFYTKRQAIYDFLH